MKILFLRDEIISDSIVENLEIVYENLDFVFSLENIENYNLLIIPVRFLHKIDINIPIICYCKPNELIDIKNCKRVADYIVEPFSSEELIMRIDNVLRKNIYYNFSTVGNKLFINDKEFLLTSKEMRIVSILLDNKNIFVSREDLSFIINGKILNNSRSLDMHISNIRKKLGKEYCDILLSSYSEGYSINTG